MADLTIGGVCSGVGMLERAVQATYGGDVIWHGEVDLAASKVLALRSGAPNLGDLTAADWSDVERPDVFCAGFPCQDLSKARRNGNSRKGLAGAKSGLWWQIADRILGPLRPPVVILENVSAIINGRDDEGDGRADSATGGRGVGGPADGPALGRTWLGGVLGSLADLGYVGRYGAVRAADAGAPHLRERWFCVASQPEAVVPEPVGWLIRAEHLVGFLLPTCTATQPGNNPDRFIARKEAAGISPNITDLRMMLDIIERDYDGWGPYEKAVVRWEQTTGRECPPISQRERLSEWMMGWPDGWVTDADVTAPQMLKMCGNGVVPQQAELALRLLFG